MKTYFQQIAILIQLFNVNAVPKIIKLYWILLNFYYIIYYKEILIWDNNVWDDSGKYYSGVWQLRKGFANSTDYVTRCSCEMIFWFLVCIHNIYCDLLGPIN